jgi:hypothetical protein
VSAHRRTSQTARAKPPRLRASSPVTLETGSPRACGATAGRRSARAASAASRGDNLYPSTQPATATGAAPTCQRLRQVPAPEQAGAKPYDRKWECDGMDYPLISAPIAHTCRCAMLGGVHPPGRYHISATE